MKQRPKILLIIDASRVCGRGILLGIARYARLHGPWTFYQTPPNYRSNVKPGAGLDYLKDVQIDGVVFCGGGQKVDQIKRINVPVVMVDVKETVPGFINVVGNCQAIGEMAGNHFLDRGFVHFAYCGFDEIHWSRERRDVFIDLLAAKGHPTAVYKQPPKSKWPAEQGYMAQWLKTLQIPLAIMACNDDRAQTVIEACKIASLRIPDDVAVLGVDDDEAICVITDPPLSSIHLDFEKAGFEAAAVLESLMTGGKTSSEKMEIVIEPTGVRTRQSTDILAIEDIQLRSALAFIRKSANQSLRVEDVVKVTTKSRRVLEQNFRKVLGRSILSEIRRVRVERVCELLIETNMSVAQIAAALSFGDVAHFSRYFYAEKNMTPIQFRKQFAPK
ncbi:MAG: DNA-binding transcriptional regulator [Sedimentisphaerales bacterium]|nr:DNA-binding transcriptional regulator [Sedimentisphaerales bacterium]